MIISMRRPLPRGRDKPEPHTPHYQETQKKRLSYNMVLLYKEGIQKRY